MRGGGGGGGFQLNTLCAPVAWLKHFAIHCENGDILRFSVSDMFQMFSKWFELQV